MAKCEACKQEMTKHVGCTFTHLKMGSKAIVRRVPYGEEDLDWGAASGLPCGDCGCPPGTFHHVGCDVECCPVCGFQSISCECDPDEDILVLAPKT